MPRGLPDYYNPDTLVSQRLANVEELLTILRGVASIDNRGRTLYYYPFDETLTGYFSLAQNDGAEGVISIDAAEIEPSSLKLDAGTGAGAGSSYIQKHFRVMEVSKAGLELAIAYETITPKITVTLAFDNGTNYIYGAFQLDNVAKTIAILDDPNYVTVYTLPTAQAIEDWLIIKMVIDFQAPAYVRLLVGLTQIDISEYSLVSDASSIESILRSRILAEPLTNNNNYAYIGHIAITIDEP